MKKVITLIISFVLVFILHSSSLADTSRSNPLHLYDIVIFSINDSPQSDDSVQLVIRKVVYGTEAEEIVSNANFFNALPEDGKEYCLAYFHVEMQSQDEDKRFSISKEDFTIVSKTGKIYDTISHSVSGLEDSATIFSSGSADFVVPMYIDKNDIPLLLYNDSLWFSVDDKEGTRAKRVNEKSQFLPQVPDDAFVVHDFLYIGMELAQMLESMKILENNEPVISGKSENGYIASLFEGVNNDDLKGKCSMLTLASAEDNRVSGIAFIEGAYSILASENILNDYYSLQDTFIADYGIPQSIDEEWVDDQYKDTISKATGAASGLYAIRSRWVLNDIYIEYCLDSDMTKMGIVHDDKPRIWVGYYDISLFPDVKK